MKSQIIQKGDAVARLKNLYAQVSGAHVKVGVIESRRNYRKAEKKTIEVYDESAKKSFATVKRKVSTGEKFSALTNAQLAAIHEFGAPSVGIPERSFIRKGVARALPKLRILIRQTIPKLYAGKITYERGLALIGLMASAEIKNMFTNNDWPPNAPSTIKAKGSSVPLIDTAQLRASISYEVVSGKDEQAHG